LRCCAIRTNNLNLDIDLDKSLRQWIDVDKTRVNRAGETTKLGDETDISLVDRLVWVWTAEATWNSSESTHASTESVDHRSIPSVGFNFLSIWLDDLCIRGLKILATWWLDLDEARVIAVHASYWRLSVGL